MYNSHTSTEFLSELPIHSTFCHCWGNYAGLNGHVFLSAAGRLFGFAKPSISDRGQVARAFCKQRDPSPALAGRRSSHIPSVSSEMAPAVDLDWIHRSQRSASCLNVSCLLKVGLVEGSRRLRPTRLEARRACMGYRHCQNSTFVTLPSAIPFTSETCSAEFPCYSDLNGTSAQCNESHIQLYNPYTLVCMYVVLQ
jgi:hypothetical protein